MDNNLDRLLYYQAHLRSLANGPEEFLHVVIFTGEFEIRGRLMKQANWIGGPSDARPDAVQTVHVKVGGFEIAVDLADIRTYAVTQVRPGDREPAFMRDRSSGDLVLGHRTTPTA